METTIQSPKIYTEQGKIPKNIPIIDAFSSSLEELFFIDNPSLNKNEYKNSDELFKYVKRFKNKGVWIHYPWRNTIVHTLPEKLYFKLRTARNKNLITENEQKQYRNTRVGVAGLSVGSSIVSSLVSTGGPKNIKIADFDTLEVSNLNRIRMTLLDIGTNKTHTTAKKIWELDPFADIDMWDKGLDQDSLSDFILKPRLDVFVDEMDDIALKISVRKMCRKHEIPVVMATDNGDGCILDIERFDIEPKRKIFHGKISELKDVGYKNLTKDEWKKTIIKIIDVNSITDKQLASVKEVGETLSGVAQLGTAASISGSCVAFAIRQIVNEKGSLPSGKYIVSPESVFKLKH